jgi:hypothetical protein
MTTFIAGFVNTITHEEEHSDFDSAKRAIIRFLKMLEHASENEDDAEEYCAVAEEINLESEPFWRIVLGHAVWVSERP